MSNWVMAGPAGRRLAEEWIALNQELFGQHIVLRVFLETEGWVPTADGMFGGSPNDPGFWDLDKLRDGRREHGMHPRGKRTLEWFFKQSHETGVAFELVIDATLKHNNIPKGEIDHVIRQTGLEMGRLSIRYPKALVIPNCRNEIFAHNQAGHTLAEVNMWAYRWERDGYWPGSQPVVCPGGGDFIPYHVTKPGGHGFAMNLIHPDRNPRDRHWWQMPPRQQKADMPYGFNESMYYVEKEDKERALRWYRSDGWTTHFKNYVKFAEAAIDFTNYFVFHDEKGCQSDVNWPRSELSRLEEHFRISGPVDPPGNGLPPPVDPPEPAPGNIFERFFKWLRDLFS
jgi:hypothetical protein